MSATMNRVFWMVDYDGKSWTAIRGDLTDDANEMRAVAGLPDDAPIESKVEHAGYSPRVKWCERLDGFGCDLNGEDFHGHWYAVKPGPGTAWTLIREAQR